MGRSSSLRVTALAGALCALASVAGCTEDGATIHVVCPISPEIEEDGCSWDPEGGDCVAQNIRTSKREVLLGEGTAKSAALAGCDHERINRRHAIYYPRAANIAIGGISFGIDVAPQYE